MQSGIITKIENQKRSRERVNIYVNDEFAFSCSTEIVFSEKLQKGMFLNGDSIEKVVSEDEYLKCKNSALNALEKSYKTEKEINDKLLEKGYEGHTIKKVMEFLKEYGFVDDKRYAEMYIKERIENDGMNKIRYSLIRKGICENIIKGIFEGVNTETVLDAARRLAEKKYDILVKSESDKKKIYKKLGEYLVRKGYSWDESKMVIRDILNADNGE